MLSRPLSLLHTADVHLGASFPYLGSKGKDHRRQVAETFSRMVDEALSRRVDLFIVAGDLFHTKAPGRSTVEWAVASLRRLGEAGITVAVAPGTHDHDGPDSVWRLVPFEQRVPGLQLLVGQEGVVEKSLPGLGVTLVARPNATNASPESPLSGLAGRGRGGLVVGVAHGSVVLGDTIGRSDFPIAPDEIASSGLHYLALGHWHKAADYSRGGVPACYSGAPAALYPKAAGAGQALLATLTESGAEVEPLAVGRCRAESLTWRVEDFPDASVLEAALLERADPNLMLDVKLTGLKPLGRLWGTETLQEVEASIASQFYFLRLSDEVRPRIDEDALGRYPEATVAGRYIRNMAERANGAQTDEERRIVEEALQLGLALLEGQEGVLG